MTEERSIGEEEKREILSDRDIRKLSHELTYRKYLMNKERLQESFRKISVPEYIALHHMASDAENAEIYSGRTYLQELAEKMQLTIRQTSGMVRDMRDRGLVLWSHDGNGSEGTYVTLTENGRKRLAEQEEILKEYYGRVITRYGRENMISLLQMMKRLETVMGSTMEEMEAQRADGEQTE